MLRYQLPRFGPVVLIGLIGLVVGLFVRGLIEPLPLETPVQVALITGTVGLAVAAVGLTGIVLGALVAARSAQQGRIDDQRLVRFVEVLEKSQRHFKELMAQDSWRQDASKGRLPPDPAPEVGKTDEIEDAIHILYTFAEQATADSARDLHIALQVLDSFKFDAEKHRVGNGVAYLTREEVAPFREAQSHYLVLKTRYIGAVRKELGLPALKAETSRASRS